MPRQARTRRGRLPSIGTAALRARDLRRQLKSLISDIEHLESRLHMLDKTYRARETLYRQAGARISSSRSTGLRGNGPNVRDVSLDILKSAGKPLSIGELADRVIRKKGGDPGANFVQNLGAALHRDRRFKRTGRGVYGLRRQS